MDHEARWDDEHGCVRVTFVGPIEPDHARALMDAAYEILGDDKPRRLLLIDHRQSPQPVSSKTREVFETNNVRLDKIAFFGMGNLNRIVAKIAVAVAGHSPYTQFFKTEAEALAWLRE